MKYLEIFSQQVSLSQPSWDIFLAIFFIGVIFLYGFTAGKCRLIIGIISLYISLVLEKIIPYTWIEGGLSKAGASFFPFYIFKIIIFVIIFSFVVFIFSKRSFYRIGDRQKWWQVMVFSFLQFGFFMSIVLVFLPVEILNSFLPLSYYFFVSDLARIVWTTTPAMAIILLRN